MSEKQVEFMVRVKLPSSGGYHSSPSGDTQYEIDYRQAIFDVKPIGFEVRWPRLNEKWPVDSEGYTYVPLYVSQHCDALADLRTRYNALLKLHQKIADLSKQIAQLAT